MVGSVRFLQNCEIAPVERLGLGITALSAIKDRKVVKLDTDVRVVWAKRFSLIASERL
jgi:hypothetical protein